MSVLQGVVPSRTNDPHVPRCALKALAATAREKWLTDGCCARTGRVWDRYSVPALASIRSWPGH